MKWGQIVQIYQRQKAIRKIKAFHVAGGVGGWDGMEEERNKSYNQKESGLGMW